MNHSFFGLLLGFALCSCAQAGPSEWFIQDAHIPLDLVPQNMDAPLVIAIIDDGIDISNEALSPYLFHHQLELADNQMDDDGNGFIDDVHGWDFSDNDPDIRPPVHRLKEFYHGTHLAGIIIRLAETAYGEKGAGHIRLMPVKCVPDASQTLQLDKAYKGIDYAINNGANLILCAWSLNVIADADRAILDKAQEMGIQIVAASGNIDQDSEQFPAAHPSVLAIGAHDKSGRKLSNATYGSFVDLTAPGEEIESISAADPDHMEIHSGTSQAASIAAACMAIMKLQYPNFSWDQIKAALMNSSTTTTQNPRYAVTIGAGKIHLENALKNGYALPANKLYKPKGYIPIDLGKKQSWTIGPFIGVKGFRFNPVRNNQNQPAGELTFHKKDGSLHITVQMDAMPDEIFVPGTVCRIEYRPGNETADAEMLLTYRCDPIDYSTLYASGTKYLNHPGNLTDGSGPNPYSPETDAKWIITAPEGKVVHFEFVSMDTELLVDKIYFFNGAHTNAAIMAVFSGPGIPPELTTWSNQVLVWFVSDQQNQGDGWHLNYTFVDPELPDHDSED